ncbi:hypothetical protein [Microbulbifer agarilyticus]|uniref:hypothetical protein n=1 Tax=Microbulbifer agarilyticus TaxID=260552 RepID=UPI001CD5548B|nr:hypothetical protein [Microbulbifer agarilyticus]MCA0901412.1 hypothetical protein [Microbulbifer agarilyticus]
MKELIIHAGSPKTGSSYLQKVFRSDSKNLNKAGVIYPGVDLQNRKFIPESNVDINGQLFCHVFRRLNNGDLYSVRGEIIELFKSLISLDSHKVFVSDESLGVMNPLIWDMFSEISSSLGVKLVVFSYYRQPDTYYPSHWSQVVRRHGEARSLIDFSKEMNLPTWRNMLHTKKAVGECFLFSYESEKCSVNGLEESAYKVIGAPLPLRGESPKQEIVNPALSLQALTAIRMINEVYGAELGLHLNELLTSKVANDRGLRAALPGEVKNMLLKRHALEIAACDEIYQNQCTIF